MDDRVAGQVGRETAIDDAADKCFVLPGVLALRESSDDATHPR